MCIIYSMDKKDKDDTKIYKYRCDNCEYYGKFKSEWDKHCATTLHLTGVKKQRADKKDPQKCTKCDYTTKNQTTFKQHVLNEHATKQERESGFRYYCKFCDYGTFSKDLIAKHNLSDKHKTFLEAIKK